MPWYESLDQNSVSYAIAADISRFIRVLAGPGTGKSFALKRRGARLLEDGISPTRILPVTFTKVAAEDLHRELVGMGRLSRVMRSVADCSESAKLFLMAWGRADGYWTGSACPLSRDSELPSLLDKALRLDQFTTTKKFLLICLLTARTSTSRPSAIGPIRRQ
jgi:hypothetical protein